jgi:hypothetical protein
MVAPDSMGYSRIASFTLTNFHLRYYAVDWDIESGRVRIVHQRLAYF